MCAQIRVRKKKAPAAAVSKHLNRKQQKLLERRGEITIDLPEDRRQQQRIAAALGAVYVS